MCLVLNLKMAFLILKGRKEFVFKKMAAFTIFLVGKFGFKINSSCLVGLFFKTKKNEQNSFSKTKLNRF